MLCRKMRVSATLGVILAAALAAPAFGQSFVGEWTATAVTPAGEVSETVKVRVRRQVHRQGQPGLLAGVLQRRAHQWRRLGRPSEV
jgi:hypothetical protein